MRPLLALFIRSIQEDTRAKLPPILRAILILVILLIIWANQRSFAYRASPGREFFMMVMMLNTGFIALMALSIFPSAIAEEKEDGTLTLLRMTRLNSLSILLGKGASRLLAALLLIAVQIPFTLLGVTLGGVSMDQILFAYAVLGGTTIFLCTVALAASVYCRTAMRAGFLTGTIGTIVFALLPVLSVFAFFQRSGPAMPVTNAYEQIGKWIVEANPVFALVMLFESPTRSMFVWNQVWIMLGGSVVFFLIAWALFDPCCAGPEDTAGRPVKRKKDGKVRPRRFAIGRPGLRPIAWKDWHFLAGGKTGFLLRLALAAAIFGGAWLFTEWEQNDRFQRYGTTWDPADVQRRIWRQVAEMSIVFAGMCAALELLLITGRMFGTEFRNQTLSSLVGVPWKVGRIIRQKILGCLPILLPWIALAVTGFLLYPSEWLDQRGLIGDLVQEIGRWDEEEWLAAAYIVSQSLLLLTTIVWFSLKLRRGALPASIAIIAGWNILFGIIGDEIRSSRLTAHFFFGSVVTVAALAFMGRQVHQRIQTAAAEDS